MLRNVFWKKKKLVLHIHDSILINNSRHTRNWNIIMCNCSPLSLEVHNNRYGAKGLLLHQDVLKIELMQH